MNKDLEPLLKNLPPKTANALVQAVSRCGKELGIGPDWVQRWIGFTIVADGLASYSPDGNPLFEFKGGAAIEMRMRQLKLTDPPNMGGATEILRPRATKDLDATYHGVMEDMEGAVRGALAENRHGFAFRVELETPDAPFMRRFRIRVAYIEQRFGRLVEQPFTNVQLEVSTYEGTPLPPDMVTAFSLQAFGIEGPEHLPCIPLVKQIAQKLHAVSEPPSEGRTNDRFRDLLDVVLLGAIAHPSVALRRACEETFHIRQRHGWPPQIVMYPQWVEPMEQRAKEMGLDQQSAEEIAAYVVEYVRQVATAS